MKQYEAVILTIEKLGGIATLAQINQEVFKIEDCQWATKTPLASVRRIVRNTKGIFNVRKGLYALEDMRPALLQQGVISATDDDKDDSVQEFNHSYYQGILVIMGNLKGLQSFVPAQDKNRRFYDGRKLGDMATLGSLPSYSYPEMVKRSSTIDTIWINNRKMPHSFFEVEHTTDIQNSLLKFMDLQDFSARMVIVADLKRKNEFEQKLRQTAFYDLRVNSRVSFLSYDDLISQYEKEMSCSNSSFRL